jgi:hypothetical protein
MSFGRPWCDDSAKTHFGFCLFFAVAADRQTTHFSKVGDLATRETKIDREKQLHWKARGIGKQSFTSERRK